ncbi:hypothetical protein D5018_14455 [Parashewanella curva]|uniref:Uncharacterized protein n=1 Tax=Parashewanella curva TaxID=2338552 RepID=A0A3L8PY50_9GAMM|nr:hypothetical protein [Parashewanella curva]RLV58972.1 hypothetical protein D5018_14455 [Parashewanella curva]
MAVKAPSLTVLLDFNQGTKKFSITAEQYQELQAKVPKQKGGSEIIYVGSGGTFQVTFVGSRNKQYEFLEQVPKTQKNNSAPEYKYKKTGKSNSLQAEFLKALASPPEQPTHLTLLNKSRPPSLVSSASYGSLADAEKSGTETPSSRKSSPMSSDEETTPLGPRTFTMINEAKGHGIPTAISFGHGASKTDNDSGIEIRVSDADSNTSLPRERTDSERKVAKGWRKAGVANIDFSKVQLRKTENGGKKS